MQVVAPEADARVRVVQVCKSQILVRRDLAAQPEEGLFGHLHQAASVHTGSGHRVKTAFGTDKGIHQKRVQVVSLRPLVHQLFILAGVQQLFDPVPQVRGCHKQHQRQQAQNQQAQPTLAASLLRTAAGCCAGHAAFMGGSRVILRHAVGVFFKSFVQSRWDAPPSVRSALHSCSAAACKAARSASLCRT